MDDAPRLSPVELPTTEPITLDEAKLHLNIRHTDDDARITEAIAEAREFVELRTGRQLLTAKWQLVLDTFPTRERWAWAATPFIDMPKPPLQSVQSITYVDGSGVTQTWPATSYAVSKPSGPLAERGRIQPAYAATWPSVRDEMGAVSVSFTAGYGVAATVPRLLRKAMFLLIGDTYEHREDTVVTDARSSGVTPLPRGVDAILLLFRARPLRRAA